MPKHYNHGRSKELDPFEIDKETGWANWALSFIKKGGIAGYLNRNYKDKTIGKEITPHVQSGLKTLGDSYQDTMYKARRGMLGPHSFVGAHAIDTIGKITPDIPLDKAISHGLHEGLGIDKPLADVGGKAGEVLATKKVLKSVKPKHFGISQKVEPYWGSKSSKAINKFLKLNYEGISEQPQISDLTTGGLGPLMTPYNSSADVKLTQWGSYDPGYGEELLKKYPLPDWSKYRYYDGPPNKNLFKGLGAEENKAAQDSLYKMFENLNTYIGSKGLRITDKNALHNLPYGVKNVWYAPDNTPYKIKADRSLKTFKLQNMTAKLRRKEGDIQSSIIQRRQRNRLDKQKRLTNRDRVKMEQTLTQKANDLRDSLVKKLQAVRSYTSSSPGAAYVTGAGTSSDIPRIENQITTLITEFEEGRLFGEHGHAISSPVWNIIRLKSNPNYRNFFPGDARNYHLVEDSNSLAFSKSKSMLERLIYNDPKYQDLVVNYNPYLEKDGQQGIIRVELMNTVDYRDPNDYSKPGKILYGKTVLTFDVNSIPKDELPQTKDEWEGLLETQLGGREPAPRPEFGEPVYKGTEPKTTEEIIEDVSEKRIDKDE